MRESTILIVDDDQDMLETCRKMLSLHFAHIATADEPSRALELYREERHDLLIVDLKMPGMSGLELMKRIHEIQPDQLVLVISGYASVSNAVEAVRSGAFDFIRKPFKLDDVSVVVERALRVKALRDENRALHEQLRSAFRSEKIVGSSRAIRTALTLTRKVSESDISVLLTGESGTGKELFAATIHENSRRSDKAFVVIDCASLPENLLESELFGYEQGAFTGANRSKPGLLETADGGTVLLDEIGEMPLNMQAKLLRCLQEKTVRRLGGKTERRIDIRVLTATNRKIDEMVAAATFREDLYYRINVVEIPVPPLRKRASDIPALSTHFFRNASAPGQRKLEGISAAAMLALESYQWPGNVRELRNVIERACALTESTQIIPQDLPPRLVRNTDESETVPESSDFLQAKQTVIDQFARDYLSKMLDQTAGNVTEAARLSGLSRPAFHRMMARYGIESSDFKS